MPRILSGILAIVFVALGVPFLVLGFVLTGPEADGFRVVGPIALTLGLALAVVFAVLQRRAAAERGRRQQGPRAVAEVVEAQLHPGVRVGVMLYMTVTIRYTDVPSVTGTFTRKLLIPPTLPLVTGDHVEVVYEAADPANFEPIKKRS